MRCTGQHHLVPLVVACPTKTLSTCQSTTLVRTLLFAAAVLSRDNIFVLYSDIFFRTSSGSAIRRKLTSLCYFSHRRRPRRPQSHTPPTLVDFRVTLPIRRRSRRGICSRQLRMRHLRVGYHQADADRQRACRVALHNELQYHIASHIGHDPPRVLPVFIFQTLIHDIYTFSKADASSRLMTASSASAT